MFKSLRMVKVALLILERNIVAATEVLAASQAFHLIDTPPQNVASNSEQWRSHAAGFAVVERKVLSVMQELDIEQGDIPEEQPHFIDLGVAERDIARLEREADEPVQTLNSLRKRYSALETQFNQLQRLADLKIPLQKLDNMEYAYAIIGIVPTENLSRLHTSLEQIPHEIVEITRTSAMTSIILFAQKSNADRVTAAARSAYVYPLQIDENLKGTPVEMMQNLHASMERIEERIAEYAEKVNRLHETRIEHLQLLLWRVRASRKLSEIIAGYDNYKRVYRVEGWIPARKVEHLKQELQALDDKIEIEVMPIGLAEPMPVPAEIDNPGPIKAFQFLVMNYGQPGYNELNPTWILAITFPLVFGIMFGDVGHGLVLTTLGLLIASGWIKSMGKQSALGIVVAASGIASMIFGFLYGSIFGYEHVLPALWLHPLENINSILIATIMTGAGILTAGILSNMINNAMKHHWGEVLVGHNAFSGLVLYWSLIAMVASMFGIETVSSQILVPLIAISGLSIAFAEPLVNLIDRHRPLIEDPLGTYLMQAFFELFEALISMLSNTLSYVRMGAFAVAHGALSMVVFILADMVDPSQGVASIVVIILGNLFVIGFEGLIVTIQTLRLEYYEFFSKFFTGNGLAFKPLCLLDQQTNE